MFDINHNFIVKSIPQNVFDAFCTPSGLDSWWTLRSAGKPIQGNIYTLYFGPGYDWRAEVIHVVPGRELTWKMVAAITDWLPTTVGFKLTLLDNNTSVAFFHKGWQESNEHFGITTFCWGQLLTGLKKYVEEGSIIPFEKRN